MIHGTVKPPIKDLPGTMKIRSLQGGSLYSEVILNNFYRILFLKTGSYNNGDCYLEGCYSEVLLYREGQEKGRGALSRRKWSVPYL